MLDYYENIGCRCLWY